MSSRYVCGVDAGATKTDCVICAIDGEVAARVTNGPASMLGGDDFASSIADTLRRCHDAASLESEAIDIACIGLAGVDTPEGRARAYSALRDRLGVGELVLENDASIALAAATTRRPAAVMMAGTGSIGYGEDVDGRSHRVGGWGHLLGDEGSGYALASVACAAVLRAIDGRAPDTELVELAPRHYGLEDPRQLVDLTHRFALEPRLAAGFAPEVMQAAERGDEVAAQIVRQGADHLVDQACGLSDSLVLHEDGVLALGGGLLTGSPYYFGLVRGGIQAARSSVDVIGFELPPVAGAALGALVHLRVEQNEIEVRRRLAAGLAVQHIGRDSVPTAQSASARNSSDGPGRSHG
jgi:N-acetylglucosamine kinase-like BadF-type ATPase